MTKFKVLVMGSGLGGLCLAHALRNNNINIEVFRTRFELPGNGAKDTVCTWRRMR